MPSIKRRKQFRRDLHKPCQACTKEFPHYVMDFDHVPERGIKRDTVCNVLTKYGIAAAIEEIKKCDYVCANCHKIRTHQRRCTDLDCSCKT